jgi:DNA repair photolyase
MIDTFKGELLAHPCAVDISVAGCGYHCLYCFAKSRKSKRPNTVKDDIRILRGDTKSKALHIEYLKRGYPVCISNRTDPFSPSVWPSTKALFQIMRQRNNPVMIQTKTGKNAIEGLEMLKDDIALSMYVTYTTSDPEVSKRIEPGAPLPEDRMRVIEWACKQGIAVKVGYNPAMGRFWHPTDRDKCWESFTSTTKRMLDVGVRGFYLQKLHFTKPRVEMLTEPQRKALTERIITAGLDKAGGFYQKAVTWMLDQGIPAHGGNMPFPSTFFDVFRDAIPNMMPTIQDFINECAAKGEGIATFKDFEDCIFKNHEWLRTFETSEADKYILCTNRGVWKGSRRVQSFRTLRQTVREFWNNKRLPDSPQNNLFFQLVTDSDDYTLKDEHGDICLHFTGEVHGERTWQRRKET